MKKKNILIVTYYYKHKNAMASVRAIKLAKFFAEKGHRVTVFTSNQIDTWTKNYVEPIPDMKITEIYAPQITRWSWINRYLSHRGRKGQERLQKAEQNRGGESAVQTQTMGLKNYARKFLTWMFYFQVAKQEDICMFKGLKAEYKRHDFEQFDTVIATYPTYGAFMMGMWLKKHKKCKQLIADFRDPLYNPGFRDKKVEANYDKKCLDKIMKVADQVVCVSKGIADGIVQECDINKPITIITNGYDKEDVQLNNTRIEFREVKVNFVYTGTLYHGKRCVDMLATVLRELIDEGQIGEAEFSFEYAGPDFDELLNQLREYGMEANANDHGFVSRERSIAMQKQAHALLLLTWNETTYQGVVPGKLFEYMAVGNVPIIALVTGDVAQSEVAQFIRQADVGCACEMAAIDEDLKSLKEFVSKLFRGQVSLNGKTEKYDYQEIAQKYIEIM